MGDQCGLVLYCNLFSLVSTLDIQSNSCRASIITPLEFLYLSTKTQAYFSNLFQKSAFALPNLGSCHNFPVFCLYYSVHKLYFLVCRFLRKYCVVICRTQDLIKSILSFAEMWIPRWSEISIPQTLLKHFVSLNLLIGFDF